jgi:uncharacterized protein with HEPN domain
MSRRDDSVPMRHMLDHAREAVAMIQGRARSDLHTDRLFQLAITRLVEIIGEAASRVTAQGQARYAEIPWHDVVNTRHRIIHGYDTIDYDIVWRILTEELPSLIAALERALPGHVS